MIAKVKSCFPALLALILFIVFTGSLLMYTKPMEDISLNLSLGSEEGFKDVATDYDNKGWRVYVAQGDTKTELEPDGIGGYTGLELGQTFYFSRVMEENLDSPTLMIGTVEQTFSVWLDDTLLYTDCPDLDNRIGYLQLPMYEWVRSEPIIITLPMDYQGKTLTIAQAFPEYSETGSVKAFPAPVKLYCGYAYESALISESFKTAIICAAAFMIGSFLLVVFARNHDWSILCLSVFVFIWMLMQLTGTSFYWEYFGSLENSIDVVFPLVLALALASFLVMRSESHQKLLVGLLCAFALSVTVFILTIEMNPVIDGTNWNINHLILIIPYWMGFFTLMGVMILSTLYWRKESWFFRVFTPLAYAMILLHWIAVIFVLEKSSVMTQIMVSLSSGQITYIYYRLMPGIALAALISAIVEAVRKEINHRAEQQMMEQRTEMILASYDNLRHQHEEVMMLRHDMLRHFHVIYEMQGSGKIREYLTDLIGQNEKVRPVVQSGNEMMDIILNSKLSAAMGAGIHIDIQRINSPSNLPLSDSDLCSLIMNLLDNAFSAAQNSNQDAPFIRLDIHAKDGYLAILCENSYDPHKKEIGGKKQTVPKHGLGLKIMRNITQRYEGVMIIEEDVECFRLKIVIPLT